MDKYSPFLRHSERFDPLKQRRILTCVSRGWGRKFSMAELYLSLILYTEWIIVYLFLAVKIALYLHWLTGARNIWAERHNSVIFEDRRSRFYMIVDLDNTHTPYHTKLNQTIPNQTKPNITQMVISQSFFKLEVRNFACK